MPWVLGMSNMSGLFLALMVTYTIVLFSLMLAVDFRW